jgi:signal peptidase I
VRGGKSREGDGVQKWWLESLKALLLAGAMFLMLRAFVVEAYWIPSWSMEPTLEVGDRVLTAKFYYRFWEPRSGDVVIFDPPEGVSETRTPFVKRIIAVEGNLIEVRGGKVFLNGRPLEEPYLADLPRYELPRRQVPSGHLFVLGDNRNRSHDGHVWGFLPKENLQAKVLLRFWPLWRVGLL